MNRLLITTATSALLAAAAVSTPAYAARNYTMYHGSDCKVFGSTAWTDLAFSGYGVKNIATSSRNIICPVTKDSELLWDGSTTTQAYVWAFLQTGGAPASFTCTVYVTSMENATLTNAYTSITSGGQLPANTGPTYYNSVGVSYFVSATNYAEWTDKAYMLCTLGAGVRLTGYGLQERGAIFVP